MIRDTFDHFILASSNLENFTKTNLARFILANLCGICVNSYEFMQKISKSFILAPLKCRDKIVKIK